MCSYNNPACNLDDELIGGIMFFQIVFDEPVQDYIPERLLRYIKRETSHESIVQKHKSAAARYEALEQIKLAAYKAQVARTDEKTRQIKERTKMMQAQAMQRFANDLKWHCEKRRKLLEKKMLKLQSYHKKLHQRRKMVKYRNLMLNLDDDEQQNASPVRACAASEQIALRAASHTVLNQQAGLRVRTIYIDDGNYGCKKFVEANEAK